MDLVVIIYILKHIIQHLLTNLYAITYENNNIYTIYWDYNRINPKTKIRQNKRWGLYFMV